VESWLRRTKGLKVGKHIDIRAVIFTSHWLGWWKWVIQACKMEERVEKVTKVDTRTRMRWAALDSGDAPVDTLLRMCWTCCLCLCRLTIMEPLEQIMNRENKTSGNTNSAAYNESVTSSLPTEEQYSKSLLFVMFLLYT
jgi:hypothetical protein